MSKRSSNNATFAFGIIFLLVALSLIAVSFSTHNWIETYVNRDALIDKGLQESVINEPVFYTRYRGLFVTCYPAEATFLDHSPYMEHKVEDNCLSENGYEVPVRDPATTNYGEPYEVRIHLLRTHFAFMILAMFFLLICLITSGMGCWNKNVVMMRATGILVFVGMFFGGAAMALFHGYTYLEVNKLDLMVDSPAWIDKQADNELKYSLLIREMYSQYGFSYILGWLGVAFSVISAILFLVTAYRMHLLEHYGHPHKDQEKRNRAYDYYADRPQPVQSYPGSYSFQEYRPPARTYATSEYPPPARSIQPASQVAVPVASHYPMSVGYPIPEQGYFETSPYDFGGAYRY